MLKFFYQNKLRYEKGQLAPFFIAFLAIIIMLALISTNLSKVTLIKTDSSNAVDAGALASGSIMANVFNGIAQQNKQMEVNYWEFYAGISLAFVSALWSLTKGYTAAIQALPYAQAAMSAACGSPCSARDQARNAVSKASSSVSSLSSFIRATAGIGLSISAYWWAQYIFYRSIRRMAREGRLRAHNLGHRYVFINSGVGAKLKQGSAPGDISGEEKRNNYRDSFSDFLQGLGQDTYYRYSWIDGQGREHYVDSTVSIDPVDTFDMRVTMLPLVADLALLAMAISQASTAMGFMSAAVGSYTAAWGSLETACGCYNVYWHCVSCCWGHQYWCCACAAAAYACWQAACSAAIAPLQVGMIANYSAIPIFPPIYGIMAAALAGLLPNYAFTIKDDDGYKILPFIICWIDDIDHNRHARVDSTQHHQGADLGLWQTRYPDIHSYSVSDFRGRGRIYPPRLRHDASLIQTDTIGIK